MRANRCSDSWAKRRRHRSAGSGGCSACAAQRSAASASFGDGRQVAGGGMAAGPADGRASTRRAVDLDDGGVELGDHAREREDVEHALATGQQVDDLAVGVGQHRAGPGQHQLGGGQVGAEVAPQALHRLAGLLQLEAGVEQPFDHLELEHVPVGVPALAPAAGGVGDRRTQQPGAGPVVELAVGDAHQRAHLRTAETLVRRAERARSRHSARTCVDPAVGHCRYPPPRSEVDREPKPHGQPALGYHTAVITCV